MNPTTGKNINFHLKFKIIIFLEQTCDGFFKLSIVARHLSPLRIWDLVFLIFFFVFKLFVLVIHNINKTCFKISHNCPYFQHTPLIQM